MQSLEVISINLWQILVSLCNLLILFLIFKKFLFKPVKKMLAERQAAIDGQYERAKEAEDSALEMKKTWDNKMESADTEADAIVKRAAAEAERQSRITLEETRVKAEQMIARAEADAELELKKAEDGIKREIVYVSAALSEKMLAREIKTEDHRALIDSFISSIGEDSNGDK